MFTTLVAVIVALALGHVLPTQVVRLRRFEWFAQWLRRLDSYAAGRGAWQGRYGVLLALLPASGLAREVDGQWMLQAQAD